MGAVLTFSLAEPSILEDCVVWHLIGEIATLDTCERDGPMRLWYRLSIIASRGRVASVASLGMQLSVRGLEVDANVTCLGSMLWDFSC